MVPENFFSDFAAGVHKTGALGNGLDDRVAQGVKGAMAAIVTDAGDPSSLKVAKALGAEGVEVTAVSFDGGRMNPTFRSRYCKRRIAFSSRHSFFENLKRMFTRDDVLIPASNDTVWEICKNAETIQSAVRVMVPDFAALKTAVGKGSLIEAAKACGVPAPITYDLENLREIETLASTVAYPVVVKLKSELGPVPAVRYRLAFSPGDLIHKYRGMHQLQAYPLIQDYIPGENYGFSVLFDHRSRPTAFFCYKRVRELPITGGNTSFAISVHEPQLIDYGIKLISHLRWMGIANVQFKLDRRDRQFKLMEINPRFSNTMPLGVACGVNLPYRMYLACRGEQAPVPEYKTGVKLRFLFHDLLALQQYLYRGQDKREYLARFLHDALDGRVIESALDLHDPGPTYENFKNYIKRALWLASKRGDYAC